MTPLPEDVQKPIGMRCEHKNCNSDNVKDYKRKWYESFGGWGDEPIALCPDHAGNRKPIIVNPFLDLPKNDSKN